MPNFEIRITAGAARAVWVDPPTLTKPSRLNNDPVRPPTYREVVVGEEIAASAIVDGAVAPLDAALDGDLFLWWFGECPLWPAPSLSSPVGQSSTVAFTLEHPGHHLLACLRPGGGRILVPIWAIGT